MADELHPDAGSTRQCQSAADAVEAIARDLASAKSRADEHVNIVAAGVWTGDSANAFVDSLATITQGGLQTVDAWGRVAEAMRTYASDLASLQEEGRATRAAIAALEDTLAAQQSALDSAVASSSATGALSGKVESYKVASLRSKVHLTEASLAARKTGIEDIARRRQDLDNRTASALDGAPGPGAAAWMAIAFNGRDPVPAGDLIDDIIDLIEADPYGNREVLAQFLSMYGTDAEVMDRFYSELGAAGLAGLLVGTIDQMIPCQERETLKELISTGLVVAAARWPESQQQQFGVDLVKAIEKTDEATGRQHLGLLISDVLDAPGMAGHIGLGILDRMEYLRLNDVEMFEEITQEGPLPLSVQGFDNSLMNTAFTLMSTIPGDALEFFTTHEGATEYWYGQHPWTYDEFEGPALLLSAITHDPATITAAATDPGSKEGTWYKALIFAGTALQQLGGRSDYNISTTSPEAKRNIAAAAATFIPEISAMLAVDANGLAADGLRNGDVLNLWLLNVDMGNLSRALGIALTDEQALAVYMTAVRAFSDDALTYITGPNRPTNTSDAAKVLDAVGSAYGFAYASYSLESRIDSENMSDSHRAALDVIFGAAGFISFGGGPLVGAASTAGLRGASYAANKIDPAILSDDQLEKISEDAQEAGYKLLEENATSSLQERLDAMEAKYTTTDPDGRSREAKSSDFDDNLGGAYDKTVGLYGDVGGGANGSNGVVLNNGEMTTRDRM